ncbi:hypothetical protein M441DRAFT_152244 [Trichoderma asperellum CBS 433.97]|uniref:Oxidoreductase NAD-binding domain-containing protein 1 n=1 Tax=Trichoderma asperellum (strain ATCC 204424 / CBS 433.97 / NBRC 101777) TaxID=1042311 RepID=A0A2T3YU52_TRIA4|nr:hypothetical protein M441DRAFT_152244 [Trichoderma asperellum CBS 433.97]PTB36044.1 hypothetical protein M441DRAFT_152244 [Trichoderma asperellum CBS 433.97]
MASTGKREGHLERTAEEPRDKDLHEVRLGRVEQVNERVRLFRLDLVSGPIKFLPGQWLDTYIPDVPKAGGFTITSAPSAALTGPSPYLELAVQESPENEPAAWLWRPVDAILGATLRVRVGGRFVFPPQSGSSESFDASTSSSSSSSALKKVVFIAGGVGVNPLISMLSYIAEGHGQNGALDVSFMYASKLPTSGNLSDIVFLDRITRAFGEGKVKGGVKLFITAAGDALSQQQETRYINGAAVEVRPRRLTIADIEASIGSADHEGTVVYVCGPPPMTDELVEKLGAVMDSRRVLTERWW